MRHRGNRARAHNAMSRHQPVFPPRFRRASFTTIATMVTLNLLAPGPAAAQTSVSRFSGMVDAIRHPKGGAECPPEHIQFDIVWRKGELFSEPLTCVPATVCTPGNTYRPMPCAELMKSGGPKYPRKPVYVDQTSSAAPNPPRPTPRPATVPPQPAPPFQLTPSLSHGNGCIKLSAGPTRWVRSGEKGWALEGIVILRNGCAKAQLTEALIGSPEFPNRWQRPIPPWLPQNFMHIRRRVWSPPLPMNLGFRPTRDFEQVFVVAGNGIMHATVRFTPKHADQLYPPPPYRIGGEAMSCAHFESGRERTVFTDGTYLNFRCHPLPWPDEQADRPASYRALTRMAFLEQLSQACKPHREAYVNRSGRVGRAEIEALQWQLLEMNAAAVMSMRVAATRGPQGVESRFRICLADARIGQIQRKWLPSWEVR